MRIGRIVLAFGVWLVFSGRGFSQPIVYQATGTREQIQPVIDKFKHDIIYGPGGSEQNPPPVLGSFNVATFEDVALTDAYSFTVTSGGLLLINAPGSRLYVGSQSRAWSSPNSLTLSTPALGDAGGILLAPPDVSRRNAFGAVFANVQSGSRVQLEGFFADFSLFEFAAKPTLGTDDYSFVGVINPSQVFNLAGVRMTGSATFPLPPSSLATTVDDIMLGMAVPLPEPGTVTLMALGVLVLLKSRLQGRRRLP